MSQSIPATFATTAAIEDMLMNMGATQMRSVPIGRFSNYEVHAPTREAVFDPNADPSATGTVVGRVFQHVTPGKTAPAPKVEPRTVLFYFQNAITNTLYLLKPLKGGGPNKTLKYYVYLNDGTYSSVPWIYALQTPTGRLVARATANQIPAPSTTAANTSSNNAAGSGTVSGPAQPTLVPAVASLSSSSLSSSSSSSSSSLSGGPVSLTITIPNVNALATASLAVPASATIPAVVPCATTTTAAPTTRSTRSRTLAVTPVVPDAVAAEEDDQNDHQQEGVGEGTPGPSDAAAKKIAGQGRMMIAERKPKSVGGGRAGTRSNSAITTGDEAVVMPVAATGAALVTASAVNQLTADAVAEVNGGGRRGGRGGGAAVAAGKKKRKAEEPLSNEECSKRARSLVGGWNGAGAGGVAEEGGEEMEVDGACSLVGVVVAERVKVEDHAGWEGDLEGDGAEEGHQVGGWSEGVWEVLSYGKGPPNNLLEADVGRGVGWKPVSS